MMTVRLYFALNFLACSSILMQGIPLIEACSIVGNTIEIKASKTLKLVKEPMYVEYSPTIDVNNLAYTIATVPFLMNVAPLVWLSGQTYEIDVMDEDLFDALEKIHQVFRLFFPRVAWDGTLKAHRLIVTPRMYSQNEERTAVLFSHGLDAVYTSMRHLDEEQVLITVWGSDVKPDQNDVWPYVLERCQSYAVQHGYAHTWVRSNFAYFYNFNAIQKKCPSMINWFGQAMQALAYIGVAAPIAYSTGCSSVLIGATRTVEHPFPYGTHPAIDNLLAFAGIVVNHDGHDADRLGKIEGIRAICHCRYCRKP